MNLTELSNRGLSMGWHVTGSNREINLSTKVIHEFYFVHFFVQLKTSFQMLPAADNWDVELDFLPMPAAPAVCPADPAEPADLPRPASCLC